MLAWHPRPFIFIHIPKCAGASIEHVLLPLTTGYKTIEAVPERLCTKYFLPGKRGRQHAKLREYKSNFGKTIFKFSFVRNPWDRTVSQIAFLSSRGEGRQLFCGNTFKEDLYIYCHSKQTVLFHDLGSYQIDYLFDKSGKLGVDFVGRFESLKEDFCKVCELIGIKSVPNLPHINPSPRSGHYSYCYDAESEGWVRKRFAKDIEFFDYKFENLRAK